MRNHFRKLVLIICGIVSVSLFAACSETSNRADTAYQSQNTVPIDSIRDIKIVTKNDRIGSYDGVLVISNDQGKHWLKTPIKITTNPAVLWVFILAIKLLLLLLLARKMTIHI